MSKEVVNYDGFDYDYTTYWKDREYENIAEHKALDPMFKEKEGNWFIDIGGSYGRLADIYADKYSNCVVLDYSFKTLKKNFPLISKRFPNITMIAANAYKMPFKDSMFDGGIMVRVLHHIDRQQEYFKELSRILNDDSVYIQEFANKIHIKARIKALIKGDKEILDKNPYQQPTINMEGSRDGNVSFLNYHPQFIEDILEDNNFEIENKQGCSYLRIPILKKILGTKVLILMETVLQKLFAKTNISPSIFFETELDKEDEVENNYSHIEEILACPKCKSDLKFGENIAICNNCHKEYLKDGNIWDFRIK
jgi:ubiquinone/menaquinone biosynthesis C-methylase UbiE